MHLGVMQGILGLLEQAQQCPSKCMECASDLTAALILLREQLQNPKPAEALLREIVDCDLVMTRGLDRETPMYVGQMHHAKYDEVMARARAYFHGS